MNEYLVSVIARICHEVNRAYCKSFGDNSQLPWDEAPTWQRESAINGVKFHLANPNVGPSASHESWLAEKQKEGWSYGPVKDVAKKEHPCYVPYDQLSKEQQAKDFIFTAIVHEISKVSGI